MLPLINITYLCGYLLGRDPMILGAFPSLRLIHCPLDVLTFAIPPNVRNLLYKLKLVRGCTLP